MNDIAELERRIAYAMERIAKGVEALDKAAPPAQAQVPAGEQGGHDDELAQLRAQLTEERLANAQLEERLRVLKQKQQAQAERSEAEMAGTRSALTQLDAELSRLRRANEQLEASNSALRKANESGVGEPHLINKSMMAELESLRAARQTDIAEVEAIKNALSPLLKDAADAQATKQEEAN